MKIANLVSDDLVRKQVLNDYPDKRPLLVLKGETGLSEQEQKLIGRSAFLFRQGNVSYYEIPLTAFEDSLKKVKEYFLVNKLRFLQHGDYLSNDTAANVVVERFEDELKDYALFGKGARYSSKEDVVFYNDKIPKAKDSESYSVSAWLFSDSRIPAFPILKITQFKSDGSDAETYTFDGKSAVNTSGRWVRVNINFKLYSKTNRILVTGKGEDATYDEFMIRPEGVNVITGYVNDSCFLFNNYPVW
jgi:hypothetical protein